MKTTDYSSREIKMTQEHMKFCSLIIKEEVTIEWRTRKVKMGFTSLDDETLEYEDHARKLKHVVTKHKKVVQRVHAESFKRPINYITNKETGIIQPCYVKDRFLVINYRLHPEALPFLFSVDGCAKNLLLYLVFFKVDIYSNRYTWNALIQDQFKEYAIENHQKSYSRSTIKQAHEILKFQNITISVGRGLCFLNPRVASCTNKDKRRDLNNAYSTVLLEKGKAP